MSDIKTYTTKTTKGQRAEMLRFYQTIPMDGEGNAVDITYNSMAVRSDVIRLIVDFDSLITTIESLQKENDYKSMLVESYRTQIDREQVLIEEQNVQIESQKEEIKRLNVQIPSLAKNIALEKELADQKVITELAVKSLNLELDVAIGSQNKYSITRLEKVFLEIERLQNE